MSDIFSFEVLAGDSFREIYGDRIVRVEEDGELVRHSIIIRGETVARSKHIGDAIRHARFENEKVKLDKLLSELGHDLVKAQRERKIDRIVDDAVQNVDGENLDEEEDETSDRPPTEGYPSQSTLEAIDKAIEESIDGENLEDEDIDDLEDHGIRWDVPASTEKSPYTGGSDDDNDGEFKGEGTPSNYADVIENDE